MAQREALIIDGVRSPRGKGRQSGNLHHVHLQRGLAQVLKELRDRVGCDAGGVEEVIMSCASQVGDYSLHIARMAVFGESERQDRSTGLIATCAGGGMGTATIIERV